eukprot:gene12728-biopygen8176
MRTSDHLQPLPASRSASRLTGQRAGAGDFQMCVRDSLAAKSDALHEDTVSSPEPCSGEIALIASNRRAASIKSLTYSEESGISPGSTSPPWEASPIPPSRSLMNVAWNGIQLGVAWGNLRGWPACCRPGKPGEPECRLKGEIRRLPEPRPGLFADSLIAVRRARPALPRDVGEPSGEASRVDGLRAGAGAAGGAPGGACRGCIGEEWLHWGGVAAFGRECGCIQEEWGRSAPPQRSFF